MNPRALATRSPRKPASVAVAILCSLLPLPAAGERVEEIVVVAHKTERPLSAVAAQVTSFDRARLDWEQVQDLGDLARYEPVLEADFQSARFGATGLAIRGIGGNRVALELDGVPLPAQFDIGSFADSSRLALDPAILRDVEILRGPASALYGSDAIGGVVVLRTLDARDLVEPGRSLHASAGLGYFSATDGTLARATTAWAGAADGLLLSAVHRRGHEADNRARHVDDDRLDIEQYQLFAKWTHATPGAGTFRLSTDLYARQIDSDMRAVLGFERFADTSSLRGDDEQERWRVTAVHTLPRLDWLDESSLMLYVQDGRTEQRTDERRTSRGSAVALDRDFFFDELDAGAELRLRRDFATGPLDHVFVAGAEWDRQEIEERRDGTQTTLATGAVSKTLLGETFPLRDLPRSTTDEVGLYAQNEIAYGMVTLIPGVRWDFYRLDAQTDAVFADAERLTDLQHDRLSLRLGATVQPWTPLTLYANYAQGFRAPPAEDVNLFLDLPQFGVVSLPNPDLEPERSDTIEAGLRWHEAGVAVEASGYYATYDDFIQSRSRLGTDPESGLTVFQSRNLESATIYGAEAFGRLALYRVSDRLAPWTIDAGLHWAEGENDRTDEPLNEVAPLKLIANLRWQATRWPIESGLRVTHLARKSDVDRTAGDVFVAPDATLLDLTTRWQPNERFDLVLGVYNLTNERYWRYADVRHFEPGDPRIEVASQPGIHADLTVNVRF